jgi:hypothetical protein
MMRMRTSIPTICLPLLVLLAACSSGEAASEQSRPEGLRQGEFESIEGMEATADQQPITSEDATLIYRTVDRLVQQCMNGEGFDYRAPSVTESVLPLPLYLSPSELRRGGYQYDWQAAADEFLENNGPDGPPDPTEGMTDEELDAYSNALGGSSAEAMVTLEDVDGGTVSAPTEGCLATAREEMFGSVANFLRFDRASESLSGVARELQSMEAYQEPLADWQQCMRQSGHDVGDTTDYGGSWLQERGTTALTEQGATQSVVTAELIESVANADADCQEASGLYEVREELLPGARDQIAEELGFTMSQYVAFEHAVLQRAERVP